LKKNLSPGTYYIVTEGWSSYTGNISLNVSIPQSMTFSEEADYLLEHVDKSKVTTGVLYDKVFPMAGLQNYKGEATDDTTNVMHFHQAYFEMYSSLLNKSGFSTPEALNNYINTTYQGNEHPIGMLYFKYNYLDTNAVRNGALYEQDGRFYSNPNSSVSPFIEATAMVAAPLIPAEEEITAGDHYFTFDPNTIISNTALDISNISVDFGDGYGVQQLYTSGSGMQMSKNGGVRTLGIFKKLARFVTSKVFIVRIIVTLFDGKTLQAISKVRVKAPKGPITEITGCNGGDQIHIVGAPFNGSAYGKGTESAEGDAYIFYSNQNCSTRKITKPVVFLDGFDPTNKRDVQKIYDEYVNVEVQIDGQRRHLGDLLRADGYDIIVYNYKDAGDLIEKNSLAVVELLKELYRQHGATMQKDFVIIGPSMGALVAQYALAYAEHNNIPLHTRLYISFDGPHQGANVPLGLEQLIDYIFQKGLTSAVFSKMKNGMHRLSSARQMIVHHSSARGEAPAADPYRSIFLANLEAVGKYPMSYRKIAVINGSNNMQPNQHLSPEGEIMYLQVKRSGLLGLINGRAGDRMRIIINATSRYNRKETSDFWLFSPLLNLALWRSPREINYSTPATNYYSYDSCPGSYFDDPVGEGLESKIEIGQSLLYIVGGNRSTFRHNIWPTFMPTTSAMDLQNGGNFTLEYGFANENIVCSQKTPFDRVYAPAENEAHVAITDENAVWFRSEIEELNIQPQPGNQFSITGPDTFCGQATYTISNLASDAIVNWSVSGNLNIEAYNGNNSITVSNLGSNGSNGTISATYNCGQISPKSVYKGNPYPQQGDYMISGETTVTSPHPYSYSMPEYPGAISYTWYAWGSGSNNEIAFQNGTNSCLVNFVGSGYHYVYATATTACGDVWFDNEIRIYSFPNNYYSNQIFKDHDLLTFNEKSSTIPDGAYSFFPNPANNQLNVYYKVSSESKDKTFQVKLFDLKGTQLKSIKSRQNDYSVQLNVDDVIDGLYIIHITSDGQTKKDKVFIKH